MAAKLIISLELHYNFKSSAYRGYGLSRSKKINQKPSSGKSASHCFRSLNLLFCGVVVAVAVVVA